MLFSHSLAELAQTDTGEYLLGIVGEIASQYPGEVTRILSQNLCHIPSFVLAEIEYLVLARLALFVEYHITVGILQLLPNDAAGAFAL